MVQHAKLRISLLMAISIITLANIACAQQAALACTEAFSAACDQSFKPARSTKIMHYYASLPTGEPGSQQTQPKTAFIAIHGFKHTVSKTFDAALQATHNAGKINEVVVIAPIFYADKNDTEYERCMNEDSPKSDQKNDMVWTCQSWMEGGMASNEARFSSFDALDALVEEIKTQWPSIENVTIAGFSAGGQFVQRYIGYANEPSDIHIRYVISDPGSWFYFDKQRPVLQQQKSNEQWQACSDSNIKTCNFTMAIPQGVCTQYNQWKYGIENMPTHFKRSPQQAKVYYAQADIYYMQGELDTGKDVGTAYKLLDKSCAAQLQGPYRKERGIAFAAYDRIMIAPDKKRIVTIIPGCKHDVACVFSSERARPILFRK